jgi:glycosyltransferase involved in cell wall biosynthesis
MSTGLTRSASLLVHMLRNRGHEVVPVDLTDSIGMKRDVVECDALQPCDLAAMRFSDVVVHLNPPYFLRGLAAMRASLRNDPTIVGVWFWELEMAPVSWRNSARYCDEVWGFSPFTVSALRSGIGSFAGRVRLMNYDLNSDPFSLSTAEQRSTARRSLGIAENDFVVGYSFAVSSNFARKNPMAAVRAFQRAFGDRADRRLILRCPDISSYPRAEAELTRAADLDRRISVRGSAIAPLPLVDFYAAIDVYLALFRSEGYGLNLLEAAQSGRPVVATHWSLAPELLALPRMTTVGYSLIPVDDPQRYYVGIARARWADPDIDDAARQLNYLAMNRRSCGA